MLAYRITKTQYPNPLDASGAESYGGRFNPPGLPMLYFASSPALAILEVRVHSPRPHPTRRLLHTITIADTAVLRLEDANLTLPQDWDARPAAASTAALGKHWAAARTSLGLLVPSVVSPDQNLLINTQHPDFDLVTVDAVDELDLDGRLWNQRL